jgi:hypothetical protein
MAHDFNPLSDSAALEFQSQLRQNCRSGLAEERLWAGLRAAVT